jgi:hypothetical protein
MDKQLLRDAQLKIADARTNITAVCDDITDKAEEGEGRGVLLDEILDTLDQIDASIEKLIAEQQETE